MLDDSFEVDVAIPYSEYSALQQKLKNV